MPTPPPSLSHTHIHLLFPHTFHLPLHSRHSLSIFLSLTPPSSSSLFPHNASHSVFLSTGLHAVKYIFQIDHAYHSSFAAGSNPFAKWRPHQYRGADYQGRLFKDGGEGGYCLVCEESPWLSHRMHDRGGSVWFAGFSLLSGKNIKHLCADRLPVSSLLYFLACSFCSLVLALPAMPLGLLKLKVCEHCVITTRNTVHQLVFAGGCIKGKHRIQNYRLQNKVWQDTDSVNAGYTCVSLIQTMSARGNTFSQIVSNEIEHLDICFQENAWEWDIVAYFVFLIVQSPSHNFINRTFCKKLHHGVSKLKATTNKIQETMKIFKTKQTKCIWNDILKVLLIFMSLLFDWWSTPHAFKARGKAPQTSSQ